MRNQRDIIREVLNENPRIEPAKALELITARYNINIPISLFYTVRADLGMGVRRNSRSNLTAESINQVQSCVASTNKEGFGRELLELIENLGIQTFKESLKIVAHMEKTQKV